VDDRVNFINSPVNGLYSGIDPELNFGLTSLPVNGSYSGIDPELVVNFDSTDFADFLSGYHSSELNLGLSTILDNLCSNL
jgi:hypothetical protein